MKRTTEEHFASHWLTIQPSLFGFLEDEVGELDDNHRLATMIEALGIDGANSHDALDDTLACAGVLFTLLGAQSAKNAEGWGRAPSTVEMPGAPGLEPPDGGAE